MSDDHARQGEGEHSASEATGTVVATTSASPTIKFALQSYETFKTDDAMKTTTTRRLMKLDPETKMTSTDAITLVLKCTEMFTAGLMKACEQRASKDGDKINVKYKDVARTVANDPTLEFLSDLLPAIEGTNAGGEESDNAASNKRPAKKAKASKES